MTPQEKEHIENAIRHIQTATDVDQWASDIAVRAMRRQIPKKLIIVEHGLVKCAECGKYIRFPLSNNCPECGQAIDWEEGE